MPKQRLLSVTRDDCEWRYDTHGGKGGQHANKNATAVTVRHPPSGAVGHAADSKSQWQNRQTAWRRMAETPEFQRWIRMEANRSAHKMDEEQLLQAQIDRLMAEENLRVEVGEDGEWKVGE